MPKGIIVFGLNGCGKSTLGRELASVLNYKYMDIETYFFIKSEIPYTKKRTRKACLNLMLDDIKKHENFVISAVKGDFDEAIVSMYEFGVFITAPNELRIERVKQRAIEKFGDRVKEGGDMYQSEKDFLNFVKSRTPTSIEKWAASISCPIIHIDGTKDIHENVKYIKAEYQKVLGIKSVEK